VLDESTLTYCVVDREGRLPWRQLPSLRDARRWAGTYRDEQQATERRAASCGPQSERFSRTDRGVTLLLVFFAATVIMVAAAALVGAVDRWWILVPVMLAHLALTFAVIATIAHLLGEAGPVQDPRS
jgi:fatty acid desaturase